MKKAELEAEYLNIASPRFSRKGDRTPNLNRTVKGRKGIGKFAGLILASEMELVTQAAGKRTRVLISKTVLIEALGDLEKVPLPLDVPIPNPWTPKAPPSPRGISIPGSERQGSAGGVGPESQIFVACICFMDGGDCPATKQVLCEREIKTLRRKGQNHFASSVVILSDKPPAA